jgi:5-methylcytosine-specific restriction endonuclease McrA
MYGHFYSNYFKIKNLNSLEPRKIAQQFISRKKIRHFIFKRDGFKCLNCGSENKLQIDHILPIAKKGENKISNLQTLCIFCNSKKRDNYKDYRNGGK